jgi:hypothetical protein
MSAVGAVPHIEIPLCWEKPELAKGKHFDWHRASLYHIPQNVITELICGSKVYRWLMRSKNNEMESCYIGESVDFYDRLLSCRRSVRKPDGKHKLLVEAMRDCETNDGTVNLEFLCVGVDGFQLNEIPINKFALGNHDVRSMMESISIAAFKAQNPNVRLINHQRKSASARAEPKIMKLVERMGRPAAIKVMQQFLAKQQSPAEKGA